jgi:hypothetical protein
MRLRHLVIADVSVRPPAGDISPNPATHAVSSTAARAAERHRREIREQRVIPRAHVLPGQRHLVHVISTPVTPIPVKLTIVRDRPGGCDGTSCGGGYRCRFTTARENSTRARNGGPIGPLCRGPDTEAAWKNVARIPEEQSSDSVKRRLRPRASGFSCP